VRTFYDLHIQPRRRQAIAGAVFLHDNHTLTCKYAASLKAGPSFRPNNLSYSQVPSGGQCGGEDL